MGETRVKCEVCGRWHEKRKSPTCSWAKGPSALMKCVAKYYMNGGSKPFSEWETRFMESNDPEFWKPGKDDRRMKAMRKIEKSLDSVDREEMVKEMEESHRRLGTLTWEELFREFTI